VAGGAVAVLAPFASADDQVVTTAVMKKVTNDPNAVVHSDGMHLWPYGLNCESEYKSDTDLLNHCLVVTAMARDLGYL
jgi:hypothetical protein